VGALGLGALVLLVRFGADTEIVRSGVQEKLRELTGHEVTLGGLHVSASFPSLVHLRVDGISINSPQGKTLVSANSLVLSPSLVSLFSREVNVKSVTLSGLRGTLESPDDKQPSPPVATSAPIKQPPLEPLPGEVPAQPPSGKPFPEKEETTDTSVKTGFRWSLDSVSLIDARLDWIDRKSVPGKEVLVSLNGVDGALTRTGDRDFRAQFSGVLEIDKASVGPVLVSGTIKVAEAFSDLEGADLQLAAPAMSLKPLHQLLPTSASPAREFTTAATVCRLTWERSGLPKLTCKSDLKTDGQHPSQVSLQGDLLVSRDFSSVQKANGTVETHGYQLLLLQTVLPTSWPIDPGVGVVKATLQGAWSGGDNWRLNGTAGVEDVRLKGQFKGIAEPIRGWAQLKLDPELLLLENLDVWAGGKIASATGKVSRPFSNDYSLDLRGEVAFDSGWLKAFGVRLPTSMEIKGAAPVRGAVRHQAGETWVDVTGDLTSQDIQWMPYLNKARGNKGHLSVKGKMVTASGGKDRHPKIESLIRLGLAGTAIRTGPDAQWVKGSSMQLDSRVLAHGGKWDLKEAKFAVRSPGDGSDVIAGKASVTGLESGVPKIDASATLNLDKKLFLLAGIDLPPGSAVAGNAPLKLLLGGPIHDLDWSAEVPLTHLDVNIKQAFRKPGGINGSLNASGKLSGSGVTVTNSRLSLPGVVVQSQGTLADNKGNFGSLTCTLKRSDLKDVAKLIPPAAGLGLSGPVEASILLKPVRDAVAPTGTIRLLSVDYRPAKAAWGLEKMKGTLALEGQSMSIPEVTGNIVGTLEGPFKIKGALSSIGSVDELNGGLSLQAGPGRIQADKLRGLFNQAHLLVGTLLNPQSADRQKDLLQIQSITGDFQINSGTVRTENLSARGPDVTSGAVGSLRLASNELDILMGVHTFTVVGEVIGKIPAVRDFIKKHEGLLSATGLDKELKRFGLDTKDSPDQKADSASASKTPVTVLFRVQGPAGSPRVTPVLEQQVNKSTLARLKSLMN